MDQTNGASDGGHGPRPPPYSPPPYSPQDYGQSSYTGMSYQVGKGSVAVVSPPGTYNNVVHPTGPAAAAAAAAGGYAQQYGEAPSEYSEDDDGVFSDRAIRRGFIRKVYLILLIQLLVTVGIICTFIYWEPLNRWAWDNYWFTYTMLMAVLVLILMMSCCDNLRRQVPFNFIALGLFTAVEGVMLGSVSVFFEAEAVMWAVGATALVSFSLTLFAMQSKWDFTAASGSLWVFGWTLFSFGLLCAVLRSQYVSITYACLGTLLFSLYLVFDTQLILGGKHRKYRVSPEEYVFAALNLYLDIVSLFLLILQFIGLCR